MILTEIAFSGDPGRKRRPAVVISIDEFNRAGTKLIVAAITASGRKKRTHRTAPSDPDASERPGHFG